MQRRLTIALIGIAMAAILFVGAGVLAFARFGAEREARGLVAEQLEALLSVVENTDSIERAAPALVRIGEAFDLSSVRFGLLTPSGEIRIRRGPESPSALRVQLDSEQAEMLESGESLITSNGGVVRGVQLVGTSVDEAIPRNSVVVIERKIATIGNEARLWFLISGAIVLIGAAVAASWLARRFTDPVRTATATTTAIASGDLGARMQVQGDDELAALGNSINLMAAELERGRAAEQQFLLSISHDLRTPLTAINGYAEALRDGATNDTEKVGTILQTHSNRLDRLVRDLLELAKLDARQFRFETSDVDAAKVARLVAVGHAPDASNRELRIHLDSDEAQWIRADGDRLAQIIGNLIDNAAKYAESSIDVSVTQEEGSDSNSVVIVVADDGPGISAEDLPHVFERLYVTRQTPVRSESSSGLGLAIVRELAYAMNGSVRATSTVGSGTSMRVEFPAIESHGVAVDSAGSG